jgi:hypothetical protein
MPRISRNAAFMAVLAVAAPAWAHTPTSAEALNRQELHRLAYVQQTHPVAPASVIVPDPVGLIVADGITPPPPVFPGLLGLGGLVLGATVSTVNTVVLGDPSRY